MEGPANPLHPKVRTLWRLGAVFPFALWAGGATSVELCLFEQAAAPALARKPERLPSCDTDAVRRERLIEEGPHACQYLVPAVAPGRQHHDGRNALGELRDRARDGCGGI